MFKLYKQVLFLSSYTIKWIKIRHFISFYNSRSLLLVTMLAHRNQIANLIRSSSILGNEVVDGCLFECERLAALCAETVGLFEDYAFYGQLLLLLGSHVQVSLSSYSIFSHFRKDTNISSSVHKSRLVHGQSLRFHTYPQLSRFSPHPSW